MKIVKTYGKSLLLAAMALGIGFGAYAGSDGSSTSTATQGLFGTEIDDIQSVTDFGGVEFDKWLAGANFHSNTLDIGTALKFGSLVISPWYQGYIVDASATKTETKTVTALMDSSSTYKTGETITITPSSESEETLNSKLGILVGINDFIGVKLGYTNDGTVTYNGSYWGKILSSDTTTTVVGEDGTVVSKTGTYYDDGGEAGTTVHHPFLELGANLELGSMTLKPEIDFGFRMQENYSRTSKTDYNYPESSSSYSTNYEYDYSNKQNDLLPAVKVALEMGDAAESFKHTFSIGWDGTFRLFDDDGDNLTTSYSYVGSSSTVSYSSKQYNDYSDHANSNNSFDLGYALEKELEEGLTLKGAIALNYTMSHFLSSYQAVTNSTRTTSYGDGTSSVTYTTTKGGTNEYESTSNVFTPGLAGGVQYMITEKLRFNGGVAISLPALTMTEETSSTAADGSTYTKTVAANGNITETTTSNGTSANATDTKKTTWSSASTTAAIGFTFFLNDNFSLDSSVGYRLGGSIATCSNLTLSALLKY